MGRALLKPSNAVAIVALILATTSTATAAKLVHASKAKRVKQVHGASFKRGGLSGVDLAKNTLLVADFSPSARKMMKGKAGAKGDTGDVGKRGPTGVKGSVGADGKPARVATAWSWFDSRYLQSDAGTPNAGSNHWFNYTGATTGNAPNGNQTGNFGFINGLNRTFEPVLTLDSPNCSEGQTPGVDCPRGSNDGGGVTVAWNANITATAEVTVFHSTNAETDEGDAAIHSRVSCYLSANKGTGSSDFDQIGSRVDASGFTNRQVETLSLVGSINRDASATTDYMVRVECRDADGTIGRTRYYVVAGSLSVVATERG